MHRRIQLNAFLMTLRKKQLLGPFGLLYTYFALIGSLTVAALCKCLKHY